MPRQTAARFLPAALLLLALPATAQDDACSMEASVRAEPMYTIPADAPVFAPLRWGMTREQVRRALTSDGWRRSTLMVPTADTDWFDGRMFDQSGLVGVKRNSAGRLVRVVVFISDDATVTWDRSLWRSVTGVLTA